MIKPTVYVIYYSSYGHIKTLSDNIVMGLKKGGVNVKTFRFPETLPKTLTDKLHFQDFSKEAPLAEVMDLPKADAFMFGFPTRFGSPAAQFKSFWDGTGMHWAAGSLQSKPFGMFTSAASQHGGQETTAINALSNFIHHGMVYVPLGFSHKHMSDLSDVVCATPWGAATAAAADASRAVSDKEKEVAFHQGKTFAEFVLRLGPPTTANKD